MRSVILRSRPGRPRWQLTTRPGTAVLFGVVSLVAAGAQIALLSSPTPWYQPAVAGFWTLVGLAFLASAAATRVRARRGDARRVRSASVPVDSVPFVPVPIRPARPRRREVGIGEVGIGEADTGERTEDLADAVQTAATPIVTGPLPRPAAARVEFPAMIRDGRVRPASPEVRRPAAPAGAVPSPRRAPEMPRAVPMTGEVERTAGRMTFGGGSAEGSGGRGPAPAEGGRHAMVEPREVPAPRESSTGSPRRARHAAPQAQDRVR
ncbi:hypothetical protein [Actinomycetospora sp.]|uniref:hypothetical protein n=1 Tax=Actinomycetospora sp. TaxID=1872135 RepID=UPI002F425D08